MSGKHTLGDDGFRLAGSLLQVLVEHVGCDGLKDGAHFWVVELGFCLSLKLWVSNLDADNCCQPLAHMVTGQVAVFVFEQARFTSIVVERAGESAAKTCDMHTAINGVDAVGKRTLGGIPAVVIL